jgi:hypothetical protein
MPTLGSSRINNFGLPQMLKANQSRCISPPDNFLEYYEVVFQDEKWLLAWPM